MFSTVFALDWNSIINQTAPNLGGNRTIGVLLGGMPRTGDKYFTGLIVFITTFAGLLLLVYLVYGGLQLLTSGGDPKKVESGKQIITNAFIGLIIIFFAFWLVQIVGLFLGLEGIGNVFK